MAALSRLREQRDQERKGQHGQRAKGQHTHDQKPSDHHHTLCF